MVIDGKKGSDTQTQMQNRIHSLAKYLAALHLCCFIREFLYQLAQPHGLPELLDVLQGQEPGLFSRNTKALACRPQDE